MNRWTWLAVGTLVVLSVLLGQRLLFLISLILLLLAAASTLWAKYCLANVTYQRTFGTRRLFHGDSADMDVEIVNAKPLPLPWLRIDDEFPLAMHPLHEATSDYKPTTVMARRRLVNVLSMRWYERVVRHYQIKGARRGVWHFGPAQIRSGDLFGFDIRRKSYEPIDSLLVYPKVVPVHRLGLPPGHPFGDFTTRRRVVEDPLRLMGTRAYSPGDSYRHIHWKATARRQSLQTKVFEPSATRPVAIFLNLRTVEGVHRGQDFQLLEFAITAAASIAREIWEEGQPVGLFANGLVLSHKVDEIAKDPAVVGRVRLRPRSDPEQLLQILEALARLEGNPRWDIANLLQAESRGLAFGTTIVVVSATVNPQLLAVLTDLTRKRYPVVFIGLGSARLEQPISGVVDYYIGAHSEWAEIEEISPVVL